MMISTGKPKELGDKPALVPLRPPRILRKTSGFNRDLRGKDPFPPVFVAHKGEPLLSLVAAWEQIH
jgi:hypothetical protein